LTPGGPRRVSAVGAAFLLAALAFPCQALDLADGRVTLSLYETTGRFSVGWQTGGPSPRIVRFLASDDPRTSSLKIVFGNQVYTMGESPDFSQTVGKTATGARFIWRSPSLLVTEEFSFIPAVGATAASGVRIDLTVRNLSSREAAIGVRYIFDTWLGEASFVHFRTDSLSQVTHELALTPADKAAWWVSPLVGDPENIGFQVMLSGQGVTVPDRVVFANWKRLSDSPWTFDVSTVRNFSLLPYSVNDSAASQYYGPQPLGTGQELKITLAMGQFSSAGLDASAAAPAAAAAGAAGASPEAKAPGAQDTALRDGITSLDALLAEIDKALAAGTPLTRERLAAIQASLKALAPPGGSSPETGK
jgi:hypothetical protein